MPLFDVPTKTGIDPLRRFWNQNVLVSKTTAKKKRGELRVAVCIASRFEKHVLTMCAPDCPANVLRSVAASIGSRSTLWVARRQRLLRVIVAHAGVRMMRIALICHPLCITVRHVGIGRGPAGCDALMRRRYVNASGSYVPYSFYTLA